MTTKRFVLDLVLYLIIVAMGLMILNKLIDPPSLTDVTPLQKVQTPMVCYSPFDVYVTDAYEVVDDNETLITSHGRIYNRRDCREYVESQEGS